jgi:branched-chain amino acid aminotransferase
VTDPVASVFLDGAVVEAAAARVPITDRGLLYGDGVFEVLRTANGRPFLLERHVARLHAGAAAIALVPPAADAITDAVARTLAALGGDARIRIVVTRGDAPLATRLADAGPARLIVIAERLRLPAADADAHGIALATVGRRMPPAAALDPRIKALAYLDRVLALDEARRAGADEAIRLDEGGRVAECATANIFLVIAGVVTTPPAVAALPGVTRGVVLEEAAAAGVAIREHAPTPDELAGADEVFVTSAVRGVMPVASIDGVVRIPGPVTRMLVERYRYRLAQT